MQLLNKEEASNLRAYKILIVETEDYTDLYSSEGIVAFLECVEKGIQYHLYDDIIDSKVEDYDSLWDDLEEESGGLFENELKITYSLIQDVLKDYKLFNAGKTEIRRIFVEHPNKIPKMINDLIFQNKFPKNSKPMNCENCNLIR